MASSPAPVAVLAYDFWQRYYGGDPNAIGKLVKIEGAAFTIIGVTRPGFTGFSAELQTDITIPVTAEPLLSDDSDAQSRLRRGDFFILMGRGPAQTWRATGRSPGATRCHLARDSRLSRAR